MSNIKPAGGADLASMFDRLIADISKEDKYYSSCFEVYPSAQAIRDLPTDQRGAAVVMAAERFDIAVKEKPAKHGSTNWSEPRYRIWDAMADIIAAMLPGGVRDDPHSLDKLAACFTLPKPWCRSLSSVEGGILRAIEQHAKSTPLTPDMTAWLKASRSRWSEAGKPSHDRISRASELLGEGGQLELEAGEPWSDQARADIEAAPMPAREAWIQLIHDCKVATSASPTAKWSKSSAALVQTIGRAAIAEALTRWFPLVDKPRTVERARRSQYEPEFTHLIVPPSMEVLKGLCWVAATLNDAAVARALSRLAISAYRKVPGIGPRAVKVGNAAVNALGMMPGRDALGQLAMLRVKVKFGTAQKLIDKALNAAAAREGLPRDEIDELGVPAYGLSEVGRHAEDLAGHRVELCVQGVGHVELKFRKLNADGTPGKELKSAPAAVKTGAAEEFKALKGAVKDISAMIGAQRDRLDSMFLGRKVWPVATWRERYLDHPLIGVLARRLIWQVGQGVTDAEFTPRRSATWLEGSGGGGLAGPDGTAVEVREGDTVRLWHPIFAERDEVMSWRSFFEERQIRQPFKQAHREVYLLTDAERRTATYSNRFAAHIIRQHQFHALCAVRGWKNKLRLMVDAEYGPPTRNLEPWGLRAEYWVEGAGDEFGTDTNEAGAYNLLTTDQVRFYRIDQAQATAHAGGGGYGAGWRQAELQHGLSLEDVPAIVLSEILRDVDLFVGVCSVANNPQWSDGGPGGTHRNYWWEQGFGDLSQTGATRRDLLSRLVPKLKIAGVCELDDKFLRVKGKLRTYKIHLGSGNILMEPNDQYLCIVPSSSAEVAGGKVFLPFEGDRTLAIILSKAFLLAEDERIGDPSITRQINAK